MSIRSVVLCFLGILAGCFNASYDFEEGALRCDQGACPPGYLCRDARCFRAGGAADARVADAPLGADAAESCLAGSRRCNGNQPQRCDGTWRDEPSCTADEPMCVGGLCEPGCEPGSKDCSGRVLRECDAQGLWQTSRTCDNACYQGACTGTCRPGDRRCNGNLVEECGVRGSWLSAESCPNACVLGECGGSCRPGDVRCQVADPMVPEACDGNGDWHEEAPCAFVCQGGLCVGSCKPGDRSCQGKDVMECDGAGKLVKKQTCSVNCEAGACAGACSEGSKQCAGIDVVQTCVGGLWSNTATCDNICAAGACAGECKPGAKKCQGGVPSSCSASGTWVAGSACAYVCAGNECGGECMPGAKRCSGTERQVCGDGGMWETRESCPFGCAGGACSACVPESMQATCTGRCGTVANNCGTPVACGDDCPAGTTCGGGGVAGHCGCTPDPPAMTCADKCGTVTNNCLLTVACSAQNGGITCNPPQICGAGGAPPNTCCVRDSTSMTCAGKCGLLADNCGVTVSCGDTCAQQGPLFTCGGALPNRCGCTPGTRRCEGATPQLCNEAGAWENGTTCPAACEGGQCQAACTSGETSCNGNTPRMCIGGQWVDGQPCVDSTCVGGTCTGVCVAGAKQCRGNTPQTCDANGQWQGNSSCSHQTCVGGACQGVCAPGESRCTPGSDTRLDTCGPDGQWLTTTTCEFTCDKGACAGECHPGDRRCVPPPTVVPQAQVCDDNYKWKSPVNCSIAWGCNDGICCESDASACPGTGGATCNAKVFKNCGLEVSCDDTCKDGLTCGGNPDRPEVCGCQPRTQHCAGPLGPARQCNDAGDGWIVLDICRLGEKCCEGCDTATCIPDLVGCAVCPQ